METFFAALMSASLILTWSAGTRVAAVFQNACATGAYQTASRLNAASLDTAEITPFGRSEAGWKVYAPQIARTIGTPCAPDTKGFAATLASWQAKHRLHATGSVNIETIGAMKSAWQQARPFIGELRDGSCPEAPAEAALAEIAPREGWLGKISKLDPHALTALRNMIAAARRADPEIAADRQMLQIVSAFRSPAYDAARCAKEHNCNGVARARCSAHRTGRAVDIYVGALPGKSPVSSDDANRLFQTQTPAYRWLVANAGRFGFVNYVFEPWHWEWVGTAPADPIVLAELKPRHRAPVEASATSLKPLLRLKAMFGLSD
ncbi:MAG: DUF882 domain-containing protein [Alphaproteobacteria bacterium]|nr:DUF882 domain-containing protein [Alphaproteobacteria bacterium]